MTNEEFSNSFDTLVSAYQHTSLFGELASIADVSLDEYEKSIFLTLALDLIVKTYFERHLNSAGEGFDDSTRRLLDYSKLITTSTITTIKSNQDKCFSENGIVLDFSNDVFGYYTDEMTGLVYSKAPLFIINEKVVTAKDLPSEIIIEESGIIGDLNEEIVKITNKTFKRLFIKFIIGGGYLNTDDEGALDSLNPCTVIATATDITIEVHILMRTDSTTAPWTVGRLVQELNTQSKLNNIIKIEAIGNPEYHPVYDEIPDTTNLQLAANHSEVSSPRLTTSYVIVPINYKDYDRMMSRAYCEPLKRQAWRLFETDSSTLNSSVELILRSDADKFFKYVVRYIRRPRPIVLVDLSETANQLSINGVQAITLCELNSVVHEEILLLAVLMALNSKGIETRDMKAAREQANKS